MRSIRAMVRARSASSYDIIIGRNVVSRLPAFIGSLKADKAAIITDTNVGRIYGNEIVALLRKNGISCCTISFRAGERSKRLSTVEKIQEQMLQNGIGRKSIAVLLGGGVVGDMGGLAAATYMRGIGFVQVPTTLLAMADSAIGGKTGVDLPSGKNMCGTFTQPKAVFIDTSFLESLPQKEFSNGMAEVVKYGVINDAAFFRFLEKNKAAIMKKNPKVLERIIEKSCRIKAAVVAKDELEGSLRQVLNYGHTVGHAIETATHYSRYTHGEAISIGMNVEAIISGKIGGMKHGEIARQSALLAHLGLPMKPGSIDKKRLIALMMNDKKSKGRGLVFALPKRIGAMMKSNGNYGVMVGGKTVKTALEGAMQ